MCKELCYLCFVCDVSSRPKNSVQYLLGVVPLEQRWRTIAAATTQRMWIVTVTFVVRVKEPNAFPTTVSCLYWFRHSSHSSPQHGASVYRFQADDFALGSGGSGIHHGEPCRWLGKSENNRRMDVVESADI